MFEDALTIFHELSDLKKSYEVVECVSDHYSGLNFDVKVKFKFKLCKGVSPIVLLDSNIEISPVNVLEDSSVTSVTVVDSVDDAEGICCLAVPVSS